MKYQFDAKNHLHTLDGIPLTGTSSIVDVLAKPLTWWASGKAVETLGWLNPKTHTEMERIFAAQEALNKIRLFGNMYDNDGTAEYLKLLDTAYKAHATSLKDSATKGTDLHAELEHYVKGKMGIVPERADYAQQIQSFIEWSEKNMKRWLWSEAHCFDEELFVGGISDAGGEMNNGTIIGFDFKSAREAYISHFLQDGGYSIQINKNGLWDAQGRVHKMLEKPIGALGIVPFGAKEVVPQIRYEVAEYQEGFRHAVALYRIMGLDKRIKEEIK